MQDQMQGQMMQGAGGEEQGQNALLTIIQLLIEQGIDPETAKELAGKILEAFAQGGEPAVEALANQLEQEEGMQQEPMMMAEGGLTSIDRARDMLQRRAPSGEFLAYINPQEAGILRSMGGAGQDVNVRGVPSFFLKSIGKAIGSVAKGVTNAVKSVVKSPIGKLALTAAAIYATGGGSFFGYTPFAGATPGFALSNLPGGSFLVGSSAGDAAAMGTKGIIGQGGLFDLGAGTLFSGASSLLPSMDTLKTFGVGALAGKFLGGGEPKPEDFPDDASYQEAVARYKAQFQAAINNPNPQFAGGLYPNNPFYPQRQATTMAANGGRIGYQEGGIGDLIQQVTKQEFFGTPMMANGGRMQYGLGDLVRGSGIARPVSSSESGGGSSSGFGGMISRLIQQNPQMFRSPQMSSPRSTDFIDENQDGIDDRQQASYGGRMGYAMGAEVPTRQNEAGVTELDYRKKGGFVPPIGIKERADDIPAMLSNNEFVFTADAVRNAGGGDENLGAKRMYTLMKNLESGGSV
jgi:hypothetical protein